MRTFKTPCTCAVCGKSFLGQNYRQKFCSQRCMYDDQNEKRKSQRATYKNICQICGKEFYTRKENENTCSADCKKKRKSKQDKESYFRHHQDRKNSNKIYRDAHKEQMQQYKFLVYNNFCKSGEETLIENYTKAKADGFIGWARHHRLETHNSDGERRIVDLTVKELKALGCYYNRPATELIWLKEEEHYRLHKHFCKR